MTSKKAERSRAFRRRSLDRKKEIIALARQCGFTPGCGCTACMKVILAVRVFVEMKYQVLNTKLTPARKAQLEAFSKMAAEALERGRTHTPNKGTCPHGWPIQMNCTECGANNG